MSYCKTDNNEPTSEDEIKRICDERGLDYAEASESYSDYCDSCNRQCLGYPDFEDYLDSDD